MTSTADDQPQTPTPPHPLDGSDLAEIRAEIDELKAIPHEELVSPVRTSTEDEELVPEPTDAIGGDWEDEPVPE